MDSDVPARLHDALDTIERHGDFFTSGVVVGRIPLVRVDGFGVLPLPISAPVAGLLDGVSEPAPYGRGGQTLVDDSVRRCRQISPARFEVQSPAWDKFLKRIVKKAADGLGVHGKVKAELYKMLVYRCSEAARTRAPSRSRVTLAEA